MIRKQFFTVLLLGLIVLTLLMAPDPEQEFLTESTITTDTRETNKATIAMEPSDISGDLSVASDISDAVQIKDAIEKVSFEKSDLDEIFGEKEDNAVPLEAKATIEEDKVVPESMKPDSNEVDSRDEVNVEEFLAVQKTRHARIGETCDRRRELERVSFHRTKFMYDPKHHLLYCKHAKVGTSTWVSEFMIISGKEDQLKKIEETSNIHRVIPAMFKVPRYYRVKTLALKSNSFTMVRHPLERLVSGYQDKMVDQTDETMMWIRKEIVSKFGEMSFTSFVSYIIRDIRRKCKKYNRCKYNAHWLPYVSWCSYCQVKYKYIIKAETFERDLLAFKAITGINFQSVNKHKSTGNTKELTSKFIQSLPQGLFDQLIKLYAPDFEMFDYNPYEFS